MLQKLYHHLEQINANTRQQQANAEHAEVWAGKISHQLEELNTAILSLNHKPPRRGLQAVAFFLAGIGLVLLVMLWTNMHRLSVAADAERESSKASLANYNVVNMRSEEAVEKAASLDARTTRLDSLVSQQAQTIVELKKLNVSAVRTVFYLQRELYRQHRQETAQAPVR